MANAFTTLSKTVNIGGQALTVSALPCGVLRKELVPLAEAIGSDDIFAGDNYNHVLNLCHQSVSKTEPSITIADLENNLMLADLAKLFQAIIAVSGMIRDTSTSS